MKWSLRIIGAPVALCCICGIADAQAVATQFVYPVGDMYSSPTKLAGNANGYKISQGFNTSRDYIAGDADSAWCADSSFRPIASTSEANCTSKGYTWVFGHTGVDLSNGVCGGTIKAIANGVVEFSGSYQGYGNLLKIKHILPNGAVIHSLYGHRASVEMTAGQTVSIGQIVGHVGKSGAGDNCHVHLSIYTDQMTLATPYGYLYGDDGSAKTTSGTAIPANLMRYFFDPLLFIDDRNQMYSASLSCCGINGFGMSFSAVSKTMFVTDSAGTTLSLQKAIDAGWLYPYIYEKFPDGLYYYYQGKKIEEYVLASGKTYGFWPKKSGIVLSLFKPGNNYLDARSRQDMVAFTQKNSDFAQAYRWSYGKNPTWSPPYTDTWMGFVWSGNQWSYVNNARMFA